MAKAEMSVVLVTGGGSGIGAAIARKFAATGHAVVVAGLVERELQAVVAEIGAAGGVALAVPLDVTDGAARGELFAAIDARFGRLDVLVNCAAITGPGAVAAAIDEELGHFERIIAVNLTAAFALCQAAAQRMRAGGGGAIVNVSSVGALAAQLNAAAYCASKAGIDALTRNLALEWAPFGIRVNSVNPGDIRNREPEPGAVEEAPHPYVRATPLGRQGLPAEIAEVVAFLASPQASFVTGSIVVADGGFLTY